MQTLRRKIGASALSLLLFIGTFPVVATTTGCSISTAQIKADGQALGTACNNIAAEIAPSNPTLAAQLTTASNALVAITSNWQTGNSVTVFNDAANAAEVVLAAIPVTSAYAPLVGIAVAAIDVLIANINPAASATTSVVVMTPNPYRGRAQIKHRMLRSREGDLKAAWNEAVKVNGLQPSLLIK